MSPLDNPIWHALANEHNELSIGGVDARRYREDIAPFAAIRTAEPEAFQQLEATLSPGQTVALFNAAAPILPGGWKLLRQRQIEQMTCTSFSERRDFFPIRLGASDVTEMMELAKLAEPGPFAQNTISMGPYFGVRSSTGVLIAMAGGRLALPHHVEISAVCTHPEHRGHGYAQSLVAFISERIMREGRIPFLHVKGENSAARVYERVGFVTRAPITLSVIAKG
ncbi:GNAT family N-acetyltransferase [Rhizobium sp. BE258]|uniref:GNAT family N-acetyltransferase n=1 Tax=Rhizobium sp. BE258 TaxID=2817722 RepID=UPI000DD58B1F|nr:GNAT family N-acetyltransferase [Rhizobium sp. BE258]MDR7145031.1 putative GNAT family acetyltransferase [Rhizobium sp. BE258]